MLFEKQIRISERFGEEYIEELISSLTNSFSISCKGIKEIEKDLIYFDYTFDGYDISFLSEGTVGTSIIGKRKIIKKIVDKILSS